MMNTLLDRHYHRITTGPKISRCTPPKKIKSENSHPKSINFIPGRTILLIVVLIAEMMLMQLFYLYKLNSELQNVVHKLNEIKKVTLTLIPQTTTIYPRYESNGWILEEEVPWFYEDQSPLEPAQEANSISL